jgi:uncharacterized protein
MGKKRTYLKRALEEELLAAADEFPVLVLTGPRQTGKSTLLRHLFSDHQYVTLDDPLIREIAKEDPRQLLSSEAMILDEIQYAPELLSYIKMNVDEARDRKGRYILTGSQHFPLMANLSETLAGRIAVYELLGLSFEEMGFPKDTFAAIHSGSYPDVVLHGVSPNRFYSSYIQTYLERDLR